MKTSRQSGMSLIELMVSLVVGSILAAFVIGSVAAMSAGYRNHDKVAEQVHSLRSGRDLIISEARKAGHMVTRFRVAPDALIGPNSAMVDDTTDNYAVIIDNNAVAGTDTNNTLAPTDIVRFYHVDPTRQLQVTAFNAIGNTATVSDINDLDGDGVLTTIPPDFDELVVAYTGVVNSASGPIVYQACVIKVTSIAGNVLTFGTGTGAPYNVTSLPNCTGAGSVDAATTSATRVIAPFIGRAFRVTGETLEMQDGGQVNPAGLWDPVALGYVNLQAAVRYFEDADTIDSDTAFMNPDDGPEFDWYSGDNMQTAIGTRRMTLLSIGLATRGRVSSVPSTNTPGFIDAADSDNNWFGDSASVAVTTDHVYRSTRVLVDLRNLTFGLGL